MKRAAMPTSQDDGDGLAEGEQDAEGERAAGLAQRVDQHQERTDREVLHQEDRDRYAAELGELCAPAR